ncbi:short chain dehydrogenase [Trichoderma barbatum]
MATAAENFTVVTHREPYAAISPSRPELSWKGKIVLVTGSASGIGFAIARAFGKASAAKVILTGRRQESLDQAVGTLSQESPQTTFIACLNDASDTASVEHLWNKFDAEGVVIDVLVLNVARVQPAGSILEIGYQEVVADLATNANSIAAFTHLFYHQKKRDASQKLSLVNISTKYIHDFEVAAAYPNYSASKSAGTILVQQVAKRVSPDDLQIVSFHPGSIFTSAAEKAGYTRTTLNWDDEDLPGHYAVWAASDEAKFLHGRFTWAAWDVDEISSGKIRERIDRDANYLKVGVVGL